MFNLLLDLVLASDQQLTNYLFRISYVLTEPAFAYTAVPNYFNLYCSKLTLLVAILLTCWHLFFSTLATQILARTTSLLDGRFNVPITGRFYLRTIVPIGLLYTGSLVCSNIVYMYLSVAFTQMLKSASPVAVLFTSWAWGVADPDMAKFINIIVIVIGVAIASFGEIQFKLIGFIYQVGGIVFEAMRIVMIQVMLSGEGVKMDPLVGLYYYAPVCTVFNIIVALFTEVPVFKFEDVQKAGYFVLFLNALVAFILNIASVFLVRCRDFTLCLRHVLETNYSLDWQDFWPRAYAYRHLQIDSPRHHLHHHLANANHSSPGFRLSHCPARPDLLLSRLRTGGEPVPHGHHLGLERLELVYAN